MTNQLMAHPWHGVSAGESAPEKINVYVEIVPSDTVKYEIDKESGLLKIDRPQKFSNIIPVLYGFVPKTYCNKKVKELAVKSGARDVITGDLDPLDICVLSSHPVRSGGFLLEAIPIGGLKMIDDGEADDKIISVLVGDHVFGNFRDISEVPEAEIKRLIHYFLTYKNLPGEPAKCRIENIYGAEHAKEVIGASLSDYESKFLK
ncbi:MAG: inorganic pyrophosphatase [Bergeyella sp.]|nr:inorganic pyrophosphatase [Bergeyella sp.]